MSANDNPITARLRTAKHIILVLSGKGGVGKSSVSTQLALSLHATGAHVGILDIDLTGPSIPRMFGLDGQGIHQSTQGWVPAYADGAEQRMACMSVGFLLRNKNDSVIWRGPKKNAMIRQFLSDVRWGELDYLVVDTPPGTSDEHLSLLEHLSGLASRLTAVIVTTPQAVALADALKCLTFTRVVSLPVIGLIENMSGYVCPCCGEISNVFSTGGGESMAQRENLTFLGALPVDTELVKLLDHGPVVQEVGEKNGEKDTIQETALGEGSNQIIGGATTNGTGAGTTESSTSSFPLLERYKKTPTYALFKPMAEKVIEALKARDEAMAAQGITV